MAHWPTSTPPDRVLVMTTVPLIEVPATTRVRSSLIYIVIGAWSLAGGFARAAAFGAKAEVMATVAIPTIVRTRGKDLIEQL